MKVPFRQLKGWGCGHYSLANLFNDVRFYDDIEAELGSFIYDMNKSLLYYDYEMWLDATIALNPKADLQNRFIDSSIFRVNYDKLTIEQIESFFIPYLVTIYKPLLNICHLISVAQNLKDKHFYVIDSMKEEVEKIPIDMFLLKYHVCEVFIFINEEVRQSHRRGEETLAIYFNYNDFTHLKPTDNV